MSSEHALRRRRRRPDTALSVLRELAECGIRGLPMSKILVALIALWCWCTGARRCPAPFGWYTGGARRDGSYELRRVLGLPGRDLSDARGRVELPDPGPVRGRLACPAGAEQDGRAVWCAP